MYNFRTDLALERRDIYRKINAIDDEIDGVKMQKEVKKEDNVEITRVEILDEKGEEALGKPKGTYITIDVDKINILTEDEIENISKILSQEIQKLVNEKIEKKDEVLVVGLGNEEVTPDALGPNVIKDIEITRHIIKYMPQYIDENTRSVSAIAPGVLGTTGIETLEIIKGVIENVKPKLLIVIDALASRSIGRISSSIQLSNTGIVPGGGVDNVRKEISIKTLGIPVISIGIPTVVETAVVVNDALDIFIEKIQNEANSNEYLNSLKDEDNYEKIKEALLPKDYNFIVTPKEIDELILNMSNIVARGINMSL